MIILEDMQIQYTPYYTHFYHLLTVLEQEYASKPQMHAKLKARIAEKLEDRTTEI